MVHHQWCSLIEKKTLVGYIDSKKFSHHLDGLLAYKNSRIEKIKKYLKESEKGLNKSLPQILDEETRLDFVKTKNLTFEYNYTLFHLTSKSKNLEKSKKIAFQNIQNTMCLEETTLVLLRNDVKYKYNYYDKEKRKLFDLLFVNCIPFLEKSCDTKKDSSCLLLAREYRQRDSDEKSADAYEKACDNNILKGCSVLAEIYAKGKGREQNNTKALELYSKACEGEYAIACTKLGLIYSMGEGVETNNTKVFNLHKKACKLSSGKVGCTNLATLYESGKGVEKNYVKALKYYRMDCNVSKKGMGCSNLGAMYMNGKGIKKNLSKAEEFFIKACRRGESQGCYNLAFLYSENKEYIKSAFFYEKACSGDFALGCNNLGSLYFNGQGVKQDKVKAKKLFKKACSRFNVLGCQNYNRMLAQ